MAEGYLHLCSTIAHLGGLGTGVIGCGAGDAGRAYLGGLGTGVSGCDAGKVASAYLRGLGTGVSSPALRG